MSKFLAPCERFSLAALAGSLVAGEKQPQGRFFRANGRKAGRSRFPPMDGQRYATRPQGEPNLVKGLGGSDSSAIPQNLVYMAVCLLVRWS